jgi:hypothetical protein
MQSGRTVSLISKINWGGFNSLRLAGRGTPPQVVLRIIVVDIGDDLRQ